MIELVYSKEPKATVASFYGMNVGLPVGKDPHAFWIVIGVSLALGGGVFAAFRYKKWL
jgi:Mg2+ and Co2+ transporter CorA